MISVVIPVKDGGADLRRCLQAIAAQRTGDAVEVVVVDSGSSDDSVAVARAAGARVHEIAPSAFNHGATRNLAASLATGDVLVFTSQDAYAPQDDWLARLTAPLADPRVGGSYGRQVAHDGASPAERFFLDFLYGPESRTQRAAGPAELTMDTTLFSNVNAAMRRDVFERFPFVDDIVMSEDQEWSRRMLLAGYELRYVADAVVRHSHAYTMRAAFRRFFDSGASSEVAYMASGAPASAALRARSIDYARRELRWLWAHHRTAIPHAIAYEASKFLGLQLGLRHKKLPLWLKRRCSALPTYWRAGPA